MKVAFSCRPVLLVALALLVASNAEANQPECEGESTWSTPVNLGAPVNSPVFDSAATFSPDGLSLYFVSNRAGGHGLTDIWVAQRACADCPWEAPVNLSINSEADDGGPSLSTDGRLLFFHSNRPGGLASDIWVSRRANPNDDSGWEAPMNLGFPVNTADSEFGPEHVQTTDFYLANAPHAAALYFGRGPLANQDIYTAPVTRDGEPLGPGPAVFVVELNSTANDAAPTVRTDGREVLFWSTRSGNADIWVSTRRNAEEPWSPPVNVGPPVNTAFNDQRPNLSRSGQTLLFDSNRTDLPGSQGGQDIWMSTRCN
jgi:hypothetical protein